MIKSLRVFAPATVANVACGFDIMGFAVDSPGDEVVVKMREKPGVTIERITGDNGLLPREAEKNTAGVAAIQFLKKINASKGVTLELHKKMPIGSGLGSSSASSVAVLHALNALFGNPLSRREMLPFAMEGERIACGTAHADNVAPALFGGFVLIRNYTPLDVILIPTPDKLYSTVVHPDIEIRTEDARKILKQNIVLKDAITQWGNTAGLVAGLLQSDYELIGRSLQDVVIEPTRSMLIPNFANIKNAALRQGALGCSISGSGPSVFALSTSEQKAQKIGQAMQKGFAEVDLQSTAFVSKINQEGPKILA